MRKHFLLAALIVCFGCARAKPLPDMPRFQTLNGTECAKHCQKLHSWCISGCVKGESKKARKTCFSQCSDKLRDCYELCLVEDRM
jgi:hypothetical protein